MKKFKIYTHSISLLADTLTPVNIYLKVRDVYAGSLLLESSDYHGHENSLSYICCSPMASFRVDDLELTLKMPDGKVQKEQLNDRGFVLDVLDKFRNSFQFERDDIPHHVCGLFGYMAYDSVRYFDDVPIRSSDKTIPDIFYEMFRFIIVIDHYYNELMLVENTLNEHVPSELDTLRQLIFSNRFSTFPFTREGDERSNLADEDYIELVRKGITHCQRGDVLQIVLSRQFTTLFSGDEFNVYRALRSINPSPYLFYFDFGNFKLFGSSPESQIQIKGDKASIYPIAGTFKRARNDHDDAMLASQLSNDEKENAEHVMLVDLARNDLSRNASAVKVEVYKEIQYYSHVIHLVSKVTASLNPKVSPLRLIADTFPAGTLSGAPKYRAITLIDQYEQSSRGFYGGAIGFLGFNGDFNHAIMIRTFLSKGNTLTYQAGAGIVAQSIPENELKEVNNKIEALRQALEMAKHL